MCCCRQREKGGTSHRRLQLFPVTRQAFASHDPYSALTFAEYALELSNLRHVFSPPARLSVAAADHLPRHALLQRHPPRPSSGFAVAYRLSRTSASQAISRAGSERRPDHGSRLQGSMEKIVVPNAKTQESPPRKAEGLPGKKEVSRISHPFRYHSGIEMLI